MSLPEDCEIYQETIDPVTGKVRFQVENKVITIVSPMAKKNFLLQPHNLIIQSQVNNFQNPI
jgi:hypothetical protein